jgi:hypothetical protein
MLIYTYSHCTHETNLATRSISVVSFIRQSRANFSNRLLISRYFEKWRLHLGKRDFTYLMDLFV